MELTALQEQLTASQEQLSVLQQHHSVLQQQYDDASEEIESQYQRLAKASEEIESQYQRLAKASEEIESQYQRLAKASKEIRSLRASGSRSVSTTQTPQNPVDSEALKREAALRSEIEDLKAKLQTLTKKETQEDLLNRKLERLQKENEILRTEFGYLRNENRDLHQKVNKLKADSKNCTTDFRNHLAQVPELNLNPQPQLSTPGIQKAEIKGKQSAEQKVAARRFNKELRLRQDKALEGVTGRKARMDILCAYRNLYDDQDSSDDDRGFPMCS